ncbi:MAG: 4Fe-4S dicluster domain-containing protein [Spirochaetaceae bacterium]|jgi:electron transport protein HydN|nr:4Fe-4S dicluster domain-containing protein [Spirochaetaceae bacterium]
MNAEQSFFVLADPEKCTGCRTCEVACFAAHTKSVAKTVGTISSPVVPRLYIARGQRNVMPVQCHHCENAPCLASCVKGAISKTEAGTVIINERACIGCKNCVMACPFGAIEILVKEEGGLSVANKCDLCTDNERPACVANCPNQALRLVNPAEEVVAKRIRTADTMPVFVENPMRG